MVGGGKIDTLLHNSLLIVGADVTTASVEMIGVTCTVTALSVRGISGTGPSGRVDKSKSSLLFIGIGKDPPLISRKSRKSHKLYKFAL